MKRKLLPKSYSPEELERFKEASKKFNEGLTEYLTEKLKKKNELQQLNKGKTI